MLSRVHWVRPELVAEVKSLTWTDDNLLRQVVYGVCVRKPGGRRGSVGGEEQHAISHFYRLAKPAHRFAPGKPHVGDRSAAAALWRRGDRRLTLQSR